MTYSEPGTDVETMLHLPSMRRLVIPLFRYRRAVLTTFVVVSGLVAATVAMLPRTYEAEMTLLVNRERVDAVMTADLQSTGAGRGDISEGELYVEIELLGSRDVLERVVTTIGVDRFVTTDATPGERPSARLSAAVLALGRQLTVVPVRKTTMIRAAYRSTDPELAARVLDELSAAYLDKHLVVHRPAGAGDVFAAQFSRATDELRQAEGRLAEFTEREQVVAAGTEKDMVLQQASAFQADFDRTRATISDMSRRLAEVESQMGTTPERHVTQIRDAGNVELQRTLKSQILELEVKRGEMLGKFTPQYPPLVQLEGSLAQLRAALVAAEQTPISERTSDQNPTFAWLRAEAARARTERGAAMARAAALKRALADYTTRARQLEGLSIEQDQLLRAVKTAEEKVELYRRKQEEERVSDALDETRIANVAVAQAPTVPERPSDTARRIVLIVGMLLALGLSLGCAYLLDRFDPLYHTSDDIERLLGVAVLATIPAPAVPRLPASLQGRVLRALGSPQ